MQYHYATMYYHLLATHSLFRWLVLASMLATIIRSFYCWSRNKPFTPRDNTLRLVTTSIVHIQFVLGLVLYFISPLIVYFLQHFKESMHNRQLRFFGMEHICVMLVAIVVITIGSAKAKRQPTARLKFKTMAIWFLVGLVLILSSVPWAFSPLVSRPYFRPF
ncbi:MAG: hypothetical protein V4649_18595 [Bacteroidota bacterium]